MKKYEKICGITMPSENDNVLEFNQYMNSDEMPYIIYEFLIKIEFLIKKINRCANNPENSLTKIDEHIPCGYSMSTIWAFNNIENKYTLYRRKD